jgi:hypothetical protein
MNMQKHRRRVVKRMKWRHWVSIRHPILGRTRFLPQESLGYWSDLARSYRQMQCGKILNMLFFEEATDAHP